MLLHSEIIVKADFAGVISSISHCRNKEEEEEEEANNPPKKEEKNRPVALIMFHTLLRLWGCHPPLPCIPYLRHQIFQDIFPLSHCSVVEYRE